MVTLNRIEVLSGAIWENYDYYQTKFNGEIWPVVKANAYGHGLEIITEILRTRKFRYLIADSYYEALRIWKINPKQQVLLIGSVPWENLKFLDYSKIALMVQDWETIKQLASLHKHIKVHLKVDTGMNRQGVSFNHLAFIIEQFKKCKKIEVEGVMSHLAEANNKEFTSMQIKRFKDVKKVVLESGLRPKYWHLAATGGIEKMPVGLTNVARLGIGLYLGKVPAMRIVSTITMIKEIKKGEKVSYEGTFVAHKKMKIGIVPMGYFEGLDRRLSNKGYVIINGKHAPILGRVCMNLVVVGLEGIEVQQWDEVMLDSTKNMAKLCKTIPYDIIVGWDGSIRRVVV